jgi:hypothetical protein
MLNIAITTILMILKAYIPKPVYDLVEFLVHNFDDSEIPGSQKHQKVKEEVIVQLNQYFKLDTNLSEEGHEKVKKIESWLLSLFIDTVVAKMRLLQQK